MFASILMGHRAVKKSLLQVRYSYKICQWCSLDHSLATMYAVYPRETRCFLLITSNPQELVFPLGEDVDICVIVQAVGADVEICVTV